MLEQIAQLPIADLALLIFVAGVLIVVGAGAYLAANREEEADNRRHEHQREWKRRCERRDD